jgi:hypothetical protein
MAFTIHTTGIMNPLLQLPDLTQIADQILYRRAVDCLFKPYTQPGTIKKPGNICFAGFSKEQLLLLFKTLRGAYLPSGPMTLNLSPVCLTRFL